MSDTQRIVGVIFQGRDRDRLSLLRQKIMDSKDPTVRVVNALMSQAGSRWELRVSIEPREVDQQEIMAIRHHAKTYGDGVLRLIREESDE